MLNHILSLQEPSGNLKRFLTQRITAQMYCYCSLRISRSNNECNNDFYSYTNRSHVHRCEALEIWLDSQLRRVISDAEQ